MNAQEMEYVQMAYVNANLDGKEKTVQFVMLFTENLSMELNIVMRVGLALNAMNKNVKTIATIMGLVKMEYAFALTYSLAIYVRRK
jgi:hypothetical protein